MRMSFLALAALPIAAVIAVPADAAGVVGPNLHISAPFTPFTGAPYFTGSGRTGPNMDAEFTAGVDAFRKRDFKDAVGHFSAVIAKQRGHAPSYYLRGASYIEMGKYGAARRSIVSALRLDSDMVAARRDLGLLEVYFGNDDGAKRQRDALAGLAVKCGGTCSDAGMIRAAIAEVDAAIASKAR